MTEWFRGSLILESRLNVGISPSPGPQWWHESLRPFVFGQEIGSQRRKKKLADHSKLAALCPYCLSWYYLYIAPTERLYTIYRRIPGPWYTIVYHHIPLHIPSVAVHIVSMQHLKHSIPIVACLVKYLKSRLLLVMYCHVYMHICIYIYVQYDYTCKWRSMDSGHTVMCFLNTTNHTTEEIHIQWFHVIMFLIYRAFSHG